MIRLSRKKQANRKRPESLLDRERRKESRTSLLVHRDDGELDFFRKRAFYSAFVIIFFFAVLVARLWFLAGR